mmetsp:Transcript_25132/g.38032  ORF Transcript_25132/g.38032 Transcript_25132/m.38032 type:complete len:81 (+) Transcript_25132:46-288(+)
MRRMVYIRGKIETTKHYWLIFPIFPIYLSSRLFNHASCSYAICKIDSRARYECLSWGNMTNLDSMPNAFNAAKYLSLCIG